MKRCPQCEFIYEDDQTCCDMDGIDLIFDSRPLPRTLALEKTARVTRPVLRRSALLSLIGVVLGVVLLAIGYASFDSVLSTQSEPAVPQVATASQQPAQEGVPVRRPAKALPISEPVDENLSAPITTSLKAKQLARNNAETRATSRSRTSHPNSLDTRARTAGRDVRQGEIARAQGQAQTRTGKPETAHVKKDSKLVSIAKKTGRFFTKPFRL